MSINELPGVKGAVPVAVTAVDVLEATLRISTD